MVDDRQKLLSELARLGARLIIQRAVEESSVRPRRLQTAEGELRIEVPPARHAAAPFVSKLLAK
jgi:hypothetical protein